MEPILSLSYYFKGSIWTENHAFWRGAIWMKNLQKRGGQFQRKTEGSVSMKKHGVTYEEKKGVNLTGFCTLDSNINYTDSIIAFLVNETDVASRKQLVATYYSKGDYSKTSQFLGTLLDGTSEIDQFKNYYYLLLAIAGDERNIYQLRTEEIVTLQNIATTNTSAALSAQGILKLVNDEVFNRVIERVENEQALASLNSSKNKNDKWIEKYMQVYPNPANLNLIVNYDVSTQYFNEDASVQIIDITGKLLMFNKLNSKMGIAELTTSSYSNGIYFIQLYSGSLLIDTKKVIIQH